jgi:hypothetical protein
VLAPNHLDSFTQRVYQTLERYIMNPWAVMKVACARKGMDPLHITNVHLEQLLDPVEEHLLRITDAEHAGDARRALSELVGPTDK